VPPVVLVVMGVSGCGKSTVGGLLAGRLHWRFEDGDHLHPASNIAKMSQGIALTDADRRPWLDAVAAVIRQWLAAGDSGVVTCSALKRAYREVIVGGSPQVRLVYLQGSRELIVRRMTARHGHFMPVSLLDSQFATLEEPTPDERPIVVSVEQRPEQIVREIESALGLP
jgi:gluconokinase